MSDSPKLTFSQRNALSSVPTQLQLGQLSKQFRALLWSAVYEDFRTCIDSGYHGSTLKGRWLQIMQDVHVKLKHDMLHRFNPDSGNHERILGHLFETSPYNSLFDFLEFLLAHPQLATTTRAKIVSAFVEARSAYRIYDGETIVAVGSEEQAEAIKAAFQAANSAAPASARHLMAAGAALRSGDWAGSVRESIHAVESAAVVLAPSSKTLGDALAVLEREGHIHSAMKFALTKLYAYASDEKGIRHALVYADVALVDEPDALFMYGACASFVSLLIARAGSLATP